VVEEMGDVLWYLQTMCNIMDVSLSFVAQRNVEKLEARYGVGE
jgi:NTP pyrophosphatase (non-canonical NTP hydrolase)